MVRGIETPCSYSDWCRQMFGLMADGGTWTVPRSGLVFTRRGRELVLTGIVDMDLPRKYQREDLALIVERFGEAGIPITDETGGNMGNTLRAVVMLPDGTATIEQIDGSLGGLQALVGGNIEAVGLTCPTPATGYINEEGKMKGLPRNQRATFVANIMPSDWIAGPMIVLGGPDDEGNDTPIPDDVVGWLGISPLGLGANAAKEESA